MRSETRDLLNRKTLQLEALLIVLEVADESAPNELTPTARTNFSWAMADLMSDIRTALNSETEARNG
ncbi:hypothetical protein [Paraburkholderia nodosa]|uniref:hypothetical protein n=1 Tax=Paraburkholderia nodosa TaxID=392320 RepID=UPI0008418102|nr:hypothetical protein [Paraburkholderia nodosa]